jgi:penicillin amidase
MLLIPKLAPRIANQLAQGANLHSLKLPADVALTGNLWTSYTWGGSGYVEEQMMMHTPARWLPAPYANWEDFLAAVVERGLNDAHAPADLSTWQQGKAYPVDIEHPIFSRSQLLQLLIAVPTGTGPQPKSGDGTTVKQIQRDFGPSDRFTADLGDPDHTTLDVVLGESGNPASPWYLDQFHDWLHGSTYAMPFTSSASQAAATHTLTLTPP